jgi:hypothetical protein
MASAELLGGDIRYFVLSCPNIGGCIPGIPGGVDANVSMQIYQRRSNAVFGNFLALSFIICCKITQRNTDLIHGCYLGNSLLTEVLLI